MMVYLLLGGNIGPVRENLQRAREMIGDRVGRVAGVSCVYRSPAWGFESPDPFYNVALAVETAMAPDEVMRTLLDIERLLGRRRDADVSDAAGSVGADGGSAVLHVSRHPLRQLRGGVRPASRSALTSSAGSAGAVASGIASSDRTYTSRPIDIDILFFGNLVLRTALLTVPHPRLAARRFALLPLCEIAPALVHPVCGLTVAELLAACPDLSEVTPVD